jgi:hypothetical protein
VAVLTSELTGIPVDDLGTDFDWPKPEKLNELKSRKAIMARSSARIAIL